MVLEDSILGRILGLGKRKKRDVTQKSKIKIVSRKRLCPNCKKELKEEDIRPNFSKLSEGDTFEIKCPYCGFKLGRGTLKKKIERTTVGNFLKDEALKRFKKK